MLISYNRLKTYLPDLKLDPEEFRHTLTTHLAEVEGYTIVRKGLKKVIVGEVVDVQSHPSSDKLHIATVDIIKGENAEDENLTIVCGAPNLAKGQKVAVVLEGGKVFDSSAPRENTYNGSGLVEIGRREVAGVRSEGMICSGRELGISNEHDGILVLSSDTPVGLDLLSNGLEEDIIFEIENKSITHRSDCFGHLGIARELSVILGIDFKEPSWDRDVNISGEVKKSADIKIKSKHCIRFSGIVISSAKVGPSPIWMQAFLDSVGSRSINNIVDITNFVMYDLGKPLHAYDLDKCSGEFIARDAKDGEVIETLDGVNRSLDSSMCVITDSNETLGIAGVMGGKATEVSYDTKNIFVESAIFEMYNLRRTSRSLSLRSDASTRFEKGLDPETTITSIKSAVTLLQDLADAQVSSEIIDVYPEPQNEKVIEFDVNKIKRVLGINLDIDYTLDIFKKLGLYTDYKPFVQVDGVNPIVNTNYINLIIPSWRRDLNIPEDLLEELARIYGYNKFVPSLPTRYAKVPLSNPISVIERKLKMSAYNLGYSEMISYSFVGDELWNNAKLNVGDLVKIANPIAQEFSYMRNDLVPSILSKLSQNSRKDSATHLKYFEFSRIVRNKKTEEGIYEQPWTFAIAEMGTSKPEKFIGEYFEIFELMNISYKVIPSSEIEEFGNKNLFNLERSAIVIIETQKESVVLGKFGQIDPEVADNFKISRDTFIGTINVSRITELANEFKSTVNKYSPKSNYQSQIRDITFVVKPRTTVQKVIDTISQKKISEIINISPVGRYESGDKNTVTVRVELASSDHDIRDVEVGELLKKIIG